MSATRTRSVSAAMSFAALLSLGTLAVVPGASAAPSTASAFGNVAPAQAEAPNPALINDDAATKLIINKYLGAPVENGVNNGTQQQVDLPELTGVEFDVYQVFVDDRGNVPVDLTTNAGWEDASAITGYTPTQAEIAAGEFTIDGTTYYLGDPVQVVTDENGQAIFDGKVGLYFVDESIESGDTITGPDGAAVPASSITGAKPFFVTLPMTNPTALNTWNYTVYAYPKNSSDTITKSVIDSGTVTSDNTGAGAVHALKYSITSSVTEGRTYTADDTYVVSDDLDERVTFTGVTLTVGGVALEPADYQVFVNDALWDEQPATGAKVEIVLTGTGLVKLNDADEVVTTINASVGASDADGVTEFVNDATFVPNADWWEDTTGSPEPFDPIEDDTTSDDDGDPDTPPVTVTPPTSNEVRSLYGGVNILKLPASTSSSAPIRLAPLSGAVFSVYTDANNDDDCTDVDVAEANLIQGGFTTGDDGRVIIDGLQTSDFYNNALQTDLQTYCLVETKAPEGYNLLADPIAFTISSEVQGGQRVATVLELPVENVESNLGNALPLTGGAGAAGLGAGALLLLGGAGAYAMKRRRDTNKMQHGQD